MLLRLTQHKERKGRGKNPQSRHRVEIRVEGDGAAQSAESLFPFKVTAQDEADLRWYLEDFLERPQDPSPTIARRVEARMQEIGEALFRGVFQGSEEARDLWAQVRNGLADLRVEVATEVAAAASLPWELLRDPATGFALATTAEAFVRAQPRSRLKPRLRERDGRPGADPGGDLPAARGGGRAVPFGGQLVDQGAGAAAPGSFDLDVLRPPTFEQLAPGSAGRRRRRAAVPRRPLRRPRRLPAGAGGRRRRRTTPGRTILMTAAGGEHGYLAFENPALAGNERAGRRRRPRPAAGRDRMCRCWCSTPAARPTPRRRTDARRQGRTATTALPGARVRLAGPGGDGRRGGGRGGDALQRLRGDGRAVGRRAVCRAGRRGGARGGGDPGAQEPGRATRCARSPPSRGRCRTGRCRWSTRRRRCAIFPEARRGRGARHSRSSEGRGDGREARKPALPPPPDVGFFGRDETLLALDRAFDTRPVVLLHAYAGSGKTTTAAEFARWYLKTGGVDGPVLFTRFEQYLPLPRVLDALGQVFAPLPGARRGALAGARRRPASAHGPPAARAGAGALGVGQRRAGGRLPGRHAVGLEREEQEELAELPAGAARRPRRRCC